MRRPAEADRHEIGDVDQRRDRPLAGSLEPALHPIRRRAIANAPYRLREEGGAGLRVIVANGDRAREAALDLRYPKGLQRPDATSPKVARDSSHAHAVLPVW